MPRESYHRHHYSFYCLCGGAARGTLGGGQGTLDRAIQVLKETWETVHKGEGHGPTDPATARKARARQEREATKEDS
jgi:hypothetical protein